MKRLILLAALLAAASVAQQPQQPEQSVVFTSSSKLIQETVTVLDKDGKPIEGLTPQDFVITENGTPQQIRVFEYQRLDLKPLPPLTADTPAVLPSATSSQIAVKQPGSIQYGDRRLLALYFDLSNMGQAEQMRSLSAAHNFVDKDITASDLVAIIEFSNGTVNVRQDFTDNRSLLKAALEKIQSELLGLEDADFNLTAAFGQDAGEFNLFSTDRQLAALQTAIQMLGRLSEKKALVYFAGGVRMGGIDNLAQMRATVNAANRANLSIWAVDARGLVAFAPMGDASQRGPGGASAYTGAGMASMATSLQRSQDALYALSADTGGKALLDNNDLGRGITDAQKAFSSYYLIGYYTTNSAKDGKFRKIQITVKEFPSAKLDYRAGYFGEKEFNKFNNADKERQLEEALMLEDPITDLTVSMEVNYFQLNRAEYYVPVIMKIPGSELALARKGGAERTRIEFIGEIKDEYGSTVENLRDKIDIEMSNATAAELVKRTVQYDTGYTLLPGKHTIKVLARDNETGRIGTYIKTFVIPNLNNEVNGRLAVSSVVLSSQRVDLKSALYTVGKDKDQLANPLVENGQKTIPSVTRVFSRGGDMHIYVQAYQQTPETPHPLVGYVTFFRGQVKAFETEPMQITEALSNRLRTMAAKFSIGMSKLAPGRYNCQITILDPQGQKGAFWQAPVLLVN